jgi:hypothetical protein
MIEYTVKVHTNGTKSWYLNDKRHREDGPAIEFADGTKSWWLDDKLHRVGGPAVEYANGHKVWYLNGKHLTEEEFNEKMNPTVKEMTVEQISKLLGHEVKIVKG